MELIFIGLEQVQDNDQTKENVPLAAAEGPEVRFCFCLFKEDFSMIFLQKRFLRTLLSWCRPAAEARLEVELHNLSPSLQVHSLNLFIVG